MKLVGKMIVFYSYLLACIYHYYLIVINLLLLGSDANGVHHGIDGIDGIDVILLLLNYFVKMYK